MNKNILNEVSFGIKQRVEENYRIYDVKDFINEFVYENEFEDEKIKKEKTNDFFNRLMKSYRTLWEHRGQQNNSYIVLNKDDCLFFLYKYGIDIDNLEKEEQSEDVNLHKLMNAIEEAGIDKMEIIASSKLHNPIKRCYAPSDFPNFYNELSKVYPYDREGLLNIINVFGLVGDTPPLFYDSDKSGEKLLLRYQINFLNLLYLDLIEYQRMYWVFTHYMEYEDKTRIPFDFSHWHNPKLSLKINTKGEIIPTILSESMFDIAYFQMLKAISNRVKLRKCTFCGFYFEVSHDKERFCPPLPFHKRSSCEMAYSNRMRKARKLYNEGKTFEEIDEQVDLPIEEIKEYIQRRESEK